MIKSQIIEKLKPKFDEAGKIIRQSIKEGRSIIIRHHSDCDGYCGAVAVYKLIMSLDNRTKIRRMPTKTPFYDYMDAIKDLEIANFNRYGPKEPLIILVDNGSSEEDKQAIHLVKIYGAKVVVIDHHEMSPSSHIDVHINPHLVGADSNITAGMVAAEFAWHINKEYLPMLGALSGISDKSSGKEVDQYVNLTGLDKDFLKKVAECVDFLAFYSRDTILIDDLMGKEKQKQLVELFSKDIERSKRQRMLAIQKYIKMQDNEKLLTATLDLDKVTARNEYPSSGKTTGMAFDWLKEKYSKPTIVLGIAEDFITIRATHDSGMDIIKLIEELRQKLPYASINGGGHKVAGTLKFLKAAKESIMQNIFK